MGSGRAGQTRWDATRLRAVGGESLTACAAVVRRSGPAAGPGVPGPVGTLGGHVVRRAGPGHIILTHAVRVA